MVAHAMIRAVRPMPTVKVNMASTAECSSIMTTSRVLAMKIRPPAQRQKDVTISLGGLLGKCDVGGLRYMRMYVTARDRPAIMSSVPHCLWTMVETMLFWW